MKGRGHVQDIKEVSIRTESIKTFSTGLAGTSLITNAFILQTSSGAVRRSIGDVLVAYKLLQPFFNPSYPQCIAELIDFRLFISAFRA